MYKGIIFDADGTLLDTRRASLLAAQKAAEEHFGITYPLEELEFTFGLPTQATAERLGFPDTEVYRATTDKYYALYGNQYNRVFDGIIEVLDILHARGIIMGVITAKTRWEYDFDFNRFRLGKYFDPSITVSDTPESKPSGQTVERYLSLTRLQKEDVLFVGDTHVDLTCARNGQVAFAYAGWSGGRPVAGSDYTLTQPKDLLELV